VLEKQPGFVQGLMRADAYFLALPADAIPFAFLGCLDAARKNTQRDSGLRLPMAKGPAVECRTAGPSAALPKDGCL